MITPRRASRQPTKQRLLEEGVRLFAEKGFRETTVGEIEAAAGLEPRRGALYRHYPSKEALLEAALEQHLQDLADAGATLDQIPVGDIQSEAIALGRWLLAEVDQEQAIVRILEQDGDRLPRLRDRFRQSLVDPGYVLIAQLARRWLGHAADTVDIQAFSAVLLGGLINYRRSTWTFGLPPADIDEQRYLNNWAHLCSLAANAYRQSARAGRRQSPSRSKTEEPLD